MLSWADVHAGCEKVIACVLVSFTEVNFYLTFITVPTLDTITRVCSDLIDACATVLAWCRNALIDVCITLTAIPTNHAVANVRVDFVCAGGTI
jgi:hypothetical protein